ncbi:hypothetical protein OH460_08310 [Vibrio sp. Makdt]|uniref:hypothetical protein n=1 Tax=Vibrio sp. Makdt TaxID=2998828 RepID=UPI0022CD52D4|nr:hypothetical protein [Vibrio sp. Makdt]MDA0152302.1 hypothetical protein [Vibrio sp. Makdt]
MKEEYLRKLVLLTKVTSQPVLDATIEHLCSGTTQKFSAEKHGVKQAAIARLTTRLVELDTLVAEISAIKE